MTRGPFVSGIELAERFYRHVVRPLLGDAPHAAALLGWGSDVLGYDTPRSTDHGWGPRLLVFVDRAVVADICAAVDRGLPQDFEGWPVRFGWDGVEVRHHVTVTELSAWLVLHLGLDATGGMSTLDWLVTPQQRILGVTSGAVFADPGDRLERLRAELAWYPDEVWRWLVGCQWTRIAQEEAFVQRTAEVGDDTGSTVIAARLARDVMRLALLLARRYSPYMKWLGTAFAAIPADDELPRHLREAVHATTALARGAALAASYTDVARRHNATGITAPLDPTTRAYHGRPAQVLMAGRFADACFATITDTALRALPPIGAIDQVADSTDVLSDPAVHRRLASLYPSLTP